MNLKRHFGCGIGKAYVLKRLYCSDPHQQVWGAYYYSSYPLSDTLHTVQHVFAATDEILC
jgi:hypothetical protein